MSEQTTVSSNANPKRLTSLERVILRLLSSKAAPGLCGKELVDQSEEKLKIGSIYVTLQRMEGKRLVQSMREDPGSMKSDSVVVRRFYTPTELGLRLLTEMSASASQEAAR